MKPLSLFFCLCIIFLSNCTHVEHTTPTSAPKLKSISAHPNNKVVGVHDGDSFTLLVNGRQEKIRLEGIDAPELGQDFGKRAKRELSSLIYGKPVQVQRKKTDLYGRTIARVFVKGSSGQSLDVSKVMVQRGMAWHMKKYSRSATLATAENTAKARKSGLWIHPNPIDPDLYRAAKKTGWKGKGGNFKPKYATSRAPANATHWLNTKTNKRHNRSCRYYGKTGNGHACNANAGVPCGICGG